MVLLLPAGPSVLVSGRAAGLCGMLGVEYGNETPFSILVLISS